MSSTSQRQNTTPKQRPDIRSLAWLSLCLGSLLAACGSDAPERRPNVLVILLDTLRADHLSCYGYGKATSPHLDALAKRSFVFEGAQSAAPWTAPSLITIMTSLHPDVHGVSDNEHLTSLPESVDTMAELLARRGYATAAFTEGGYAKATFGLGQGFDLYPANPGDEKSLSAHRDSPSRLISNLDRLLSWLAERTPEQPFLGFFQTYEIHAPFRAPEEYVRRYQTDYDEKQEHADCAAAIEKWNADGELNTRQLRLLQRHLMHCSFAGMPRMDRLSEWLEYGDQHGIELHREKMGQDSNLVAWVTNLYDAEIEFTDTELQRLWQALEANDQLDNTIVIVLSDHGESLGDHKHLEHGLTLYEELLNVAYIMHIPMKGFEPRRIEFPARTVDILPTVLELLDVASGSTPLQGESLVDLLRGSPHAPAASFAHSHAWGIDKHAVLKDGWRLIVDNTTGRRELYNLNEDPEESVNLVESQPDVAHRLFTQLTEQRSSDRQLRQKIGGGQDRAHVDSETLKEIQGLGYGDGPNPAVK